jgi:HEAT repeat protein
VGMGGRDRAQQSAGEVSGRDAGVAPERTEGADSGCEVVAVKSACFTFGPSSCHLRAVEESNVAAMVTGLVVLVLAAQPEVCCSTVDECFSRLSAKGSEPADPPDPRPSVRQCEAQALARFGEPVVPRLLTLLKSNRWPVRDGAADALSLISPPPTVAVPALIACLKRDHAGAAMHALRVIDDPRAAPSIVDALAHGAAYLELKPAIWKAAILPAVDALVSPTTKGRDELLDLLQSHPELKPSLDVALALQRRLRGMLNTKPTRRPRGCGEGVNVEVAPPRRRPRTLELGPCMPNTGYLILALERFGPDAAFVIPDIEKALARDPDALEVAAGDALLALGATSAQLLIKQKLTSATVEVVCSGLHDFMKLPRESTLDAQVRVLLTHDDPRVVGLAAFALARLGDSSGLAAAKADLGSVDYGRVEQALVTIGTLSKQFPDGLALIQATLSTHSSAEVRGEAARVLTALDGLAHNIPPIACGVRRGEFAVLPGPLISCSEQRCFVATDRGEFGGELIERNEGRDRQIADRINVRGFFTKGSSLFVFDGLEHLSTARGRLWRVVREGGTHLELVTDLPGSPHAWRLDGSTLTVVTHGELEEVDCKERVFSVVLP